MEVASIAELLNKYGALVILASLFLVIAIAVMWPSIGLVKAALMRAIRKISKTERIQKPGEHDPADVTGEGGDALSRAPTRAMLAAIPLGCPGRCAVTRPALRDHYFFTTVEALLEDDVRRLECGCPGRTQLFRDMVRVLCRRWRGFISAFLDDQESGVIATKSPDHGYNLGHELLNDLQKWRRETEASWREESVPEVAIAAFSEWIQPRLDRLRDVTGHVASAQYFFDNIERMAAVLSLHELSLRLLVIDLGHVIYSLNGRLDRVEYRGYVIAPVADLLHAKIRMENGQRAAADRIRKQLRTPAGGIDITPIMGERVSSEPRVVHPDRHQQQRPQQ